MSDISIETRVPTKERLEPSGKVVDCEIGRSQVEIRGLDISPLAEAVRIGGRVFVPTEFPDEWDFEWFTGKIYHR